MNTCSNMLDSSREAATLRLRLAEVHRLNARRLQWDSDARNDFCNTSYLHVTEEGSAIARSRCMFPSAAGCNPPPAAVCCRCRTSRQTSRRCRCCPPRRCPRRCWRRRRCRATAARRAARRHQALQLAPMGAALELQLINTCRRQTRCLPSSMTHITAVNRNADGRCLVP